MRETDAIDIVIGIPALNEGATIKDVVVPLDKGLQKFYPNVRSRIILLDSNSEDDTVAKFNSDPTVTDKIVIQSGKRGKGRNIINLLKFSIEHNVSCICMVDADISNVSEDWVYKLIDPILSGRADFVSPIYKRGKFAGNITNLICRPVLYGLCGSFISQPIGGDFAFSLSYAKSLSAEIASFDDNILSIVNEFGIDILMTYHYLAEAFKYEEVDLGEKLDKPGFFHMDNVFTGECSLLFYLISNHNIKQSNHLEIRARDFIRESNPYPDEELEKRKQYAISLRENEYQLRPNDSVRANLIPSSMRNKDVLTAQEFDALLVRIITSLQKETRMDAAAVSHIIDVMRPYFHLRIWSYFHDIREKKPADVEDILIQSCNFMRQNLAENHF